MPLVRTVSVLLGVKGQEDVKAKLEQVKLRADELAKMDPTLTVDINTAAAEAKLAILRESLLRTSKDANKGFKLNVGSGAPGFLGTIQKALNSILALGPPAIPILAGIAVAVLAIVTYLGGLITELAAAGIGIAAFGALALPTFMDIVGGIQGVSAAVTKFNTDKMVKGITSAQLAADKLAKDKAWAAIPVALQPAVKAGLALKDTFDKMVAAMRPTAVKVFGDALKIVSDILPQLLPIALSVGKAIDGLLKGFDGFARSQGFKNFMSQMDALAGPAVTAIGQGIGQITAALGQLVTAGASPGGLLELRMTFTLIAGAVRGLAWAIRTSGSAIQGLLNAALSMAGPVIGTIKRITDAFLTMVSTLARIGSHFPGFGWLKGVADSADNAKRHADNAFAGILAGAAALKARIAAMPIIYHLQGEMADLQNKVAAGKALLKTVPKSQSTAIRADISQAQQQIAAIKAQLAILNGTSVNTYVNVITIPGTGPHRAAGGPITQRAMTLVGELGPELVDLPVGSYVHSHADSSRMMAAGAGGDMSGAALSGLAGRLDAVVGLLSELIAAVDDNASATANGVAQVLGGAAKSAHYASLYGA